MGQKCKGGKNDLYSNWENENMGELFIISEWERPF